VKIRTPSKKVCSEFRLAYELNGAQKGVDVLTGYYGIRRMKVVVDGRRISKKKSWQAEYCRGKGYFKKRRLNRRLVLHELYHHVVECMELDMTRTQEESLANEFARKVARRGR
jgi:hypothetical protein